MTYEFGKDHRDDLSTASVQDLCNLFDTTQVLEKVLLGQVNCPRISQNCEDLIDRMFIVEISDRQVAITTELRSRVPASHEEARCRSSALAIWGMLDHDFRDARSHVTELFIHKHD